MREFPFIVWPEIAAHRGDASVVSTRGKVAESGSAKGKPPEFSAFESLLKRVVETPKEAVNQAEREWKKSGSRRRRKRRGRAEE